MRECRKEAGGCNLLCFQPGVWEWSQGALGLRPAGWEGPGNHFSEYVCCSTKFKVLEAVMDKTQFLWLFGF